MDFSGIINCDHFSINDNLQKCVDPLTAPLSKARSIYLRDTLVPQLCATTSAGCYVSAVSLPSPR